MRLIRAATAALCAVGCSSIRCARPAVPRLACGDAEQADMEGSALLYARLGKGDSPHRQALLVLAHLAVGGGGGVHPVSTLLPG